MILKQSDFPTFEGSTGGWLSSAKTEEKYVITWQSKANHFFELPTGGTAIMNNGKNVAYFSRKEQCLALGTLLRSFKINDYKVFRIYPPLGISLVHPFDGVFPEKVNKGRLPVGTRNIACANNPDPAKVKFTGSSTYSGDNDYEIDVIPYFYDTVS
jgi:photosystem I subunit 2